MTTVRSGSARHLRQAAMMLLAGGLLLFAAPTAAAQSQDQADTARPATFGDAVGYQSLLQEYARLQRKPGSELQEDPSGIDIDGLVVDETQSKIARDFYDVFYGAWQAPRGARGFTITVSERPMPNMSTVVEVSVNDNTVYRNRVKARYEEIEKAAQQAVRYTQRHIAQQMQKAQTTR